MTPSFLPRFLPTFALLSVSALAPVAFSQTGAQTPSPASTHQPHVDTTYGTRPLQFEENRGQTDSSIKFLSRGPGYTIFLQPTVATFAVRKTSNAPKGVSASTRGEVIRMTLEGANNKAVMSAEQPMKGYVNYLLGNDRSKWLTAVPTFAQTRVPEVYPGVNLVYYGTQRQLEYDFVVAPGAKTESIRFSLRGAKPVVGENGDLMLQAGKSSSSQDIRIDKPVFYQEFNGSRRSVEGAFTVAANGEVGFRVGSYDHNHALVIDPIISYASYFGGSGEDEINGSALNSNNQLYAVGQTKSVDLPVTTGEYQSTNATTAFNNNYHQAFITKFSADGTSVLWTTYLGGTQLETYALAVAVSGADQAYVTGVTGATVNGFPITADAVQPLGCPAGANAQGAVGYGPYTQEISSGCGGEVFVSRLSSDGKTLVYSTYLGGASNYADIGYAIALDASNNMYIAGQANSTGYEYAQSSNLSDQPSWPINQHGLPAFGGSAYPTTPNAYNTAFALAKATATAAGPDSNGNVSYIFGYPVAVVTEISADGTRLIYSSAIGGTNLGSCGNGNCTTYATSVAPGPNGLIYVGGFTSSSNFPVTANAFASSCTPVNAQPGANCAPTGWMAAFDPSKSGSASLAWSTYITGSASADLVPTSNVSAIAVDSDGNVVATGYTDATNFPTTNGTLQPACFRFVSNPDQCELEAFATKLSPAGATIWSTYLGATSEDGAPTMGRGLALDAKNNVYLLATSSSSRLPTKNPIVATTGNTDAYLAELSPTASTLLMGTYLGSGGGISLSNSLSLDSNLNAYFSGSQGYNNYGGTSFPITANAFQKTLLGSTDGFVVKMITQQQPSATALTVSPNPAAPAQAVTLTATVTTPSTLTGTIRPTGIVTFYNGTAMLGTGTLNAAGVATYTGTLAAATYTITASYAGDAGFNSSVSAATSLAVSSAVNTTTTVTVAPATSAYGSSEVLTATVKAGTTGATSGTVSFGSGTVNFGSASVNAQGVATLTVTPSVGIYSVVATYAGTYNQTTNPNGYGPSVSAGSALTITKATSTTVLTSSTASAGTGVNITLTATVPTAATGTVTFYNGTASLGQGTVSNGAATFTTSFAAANTYSLTAVYSGDSNFSGSTSAVLSQVVVVAGFSVTASPSNLTVARGSTGNTTLTFTPVGGYSGSVTLSCGSLPSNVSCTFNPATVALAGSSVTDVLTIGTGTLTGALSMPRMFGSTHKDISVAFLFGMPLSILALSGAAKRRKLLRGMWRMKMLLLLSLAGVVSLTGCGNSNMGANATPAGTYSISVTITPSTGAAQTVPLNVVVQ